MVRVGIVGLPNAGKSTLFNALTNAGAEVASYPFTTIDPNVGVVAVPDERLRNIAEITRPERLTRTAIEFVDIAGLVKGASRGEGLGNRFLGHIREVDAIAHVVRCFGDPDVAHVAGDLADPVRDAETVELELIMADLETVEKRREKAARMQKGGNKQYAEETARLDWLKGQLEKGKLAGEVVVSEDERAAFKDLFLLTMKPTIYVANTGEDDACGGLGHVQRLREWASARLPDPRVLAISARIESELGELNSDEAAEYLREMGMETSALDSIIIASYKALGLITFYTTKGPETRAWTLEQGSTAPQAAGKVHSDMERGFIRAEVIGYEDLIRVGSFVEAREQGVSRQEGRDYIVRDGDVILFRFSEQAHR